MDYRPLGQTGLQLSALGFGGAPLGGVFGPIHEAEAIRTVHRALDLGVNFFDSSPYYGAGEAERVLGRALQGVAREKFVVSTKVGRYGIVGGRQTFDFSAVHVRRSVDENLGRLGLDAVDLLLCHDIEHVALPQICEETLPALRGVVREGKARFIGVSGLPFKAFRDVLSRSDVDVILSYYRHSLLNDDLRAVLPGFAKRGVGVIFAAPLAMGL